MIYELTAEKCAEHLGGICSFKTVSNADESLMDFSQFDALHEYLRETYPNVFSKMSVEKVGKAGLLLHLKGTGDGSKKPLLFMAHQDVVPEGNVSDWKYPPFSGTVAEGKVWGRGAWDCKSNLAAQMEAMEHICSSGWTPSFDIWLSYGYNEEVGTGIGDRSSAVMASSLLASRGIFFEGVFDECGGMTVGESEGVFGNICSIGVAEKGYADYEITRRDHGGHSRSPHKDSALCYIARAILAIEENPFPYRITDTIRTKLETLAPHFMDARRAALFSDLDKNWDEIVPILDADPVLAACFHTTMGLTQASGAARPNIMPELGRLVVNCRILEGDTVDSVRRYIESIIPKGMEVRLINGADPSPISEFECSLKDIIDETARKMYGNCVTVPNLVLGGTDAKNMYNLSRHVYRFTPFAPLRWQVMAHVVNEAVGVEEIGAGPKFYVEMLKAYDKSETK